MMDPLDASPFASYFATLSETQGTAGPIGELTAYLANDQITPESLSAIYERHDRPSEPWFLAQRIDLFFGYVQHCLTVDGHVTSPRLQDLTALQTLLRIPPGACAKIRPVEVATILRQQLEEILADAVIDSAEDLYQVELQAIFGLGYDEYLRMTRVVFERVWSELQQEAATQDIDRAAPIHVKIAAIEAIVRLALAQPRSMGALYT